MAKMTAIEIVNEVAKRVGEAPSLPTIEFSSATDPTNTDKTGRFLLAACNQAARISMILNNWHEAAFVATFYSVDTTLSTGGAGTRYNPYVAGYNLEEIAPGFDTMLSKDINAVEPSTGATTIQKKYGALSYDAYMIKKYRPNENLSDTANGYIIRDSQFLCFAKNLPYDGVSTPKRSTECTFLYKTYFAAKKAIIVNDGVPVWSPNPLTDLKEYATLNNDTFLLDDELIITGGAMYFKSYLNIPNQQEQQIYQSYLEHLKNARGSTRIIESQFGLGVSQPISQVQVPSDSGYLPQR